MHDEGKLVNDLVFRLRPDPADDMGGHTKHYFKSPPEAVSRFLNARNSVHLPDATDPSIVGHALRKRGTIRVLQLPGTIGKSQDLSTLDYPDVKMSDMDPDEAEMFAAFPAFMEGANQSINLGKVCLHLSERPHER